MAKLVQGAIVSKPQQEAPSPQEPVTEMIPESTIH